MNSFRLDSYQVGVLCALPLEKAAVEAALDEEHDQPEGIPPQDEHSYTFGRIGAHNVVVACLPDGMTGKASAARVGADVTRTFPIKIGLMVGIGGGAPSKMNDIRLGDVVVSKPHGIHGGVIQYDFGKELPNGFSRTTTLSKPPPALLSALAGLRAKHERPKWNKIPEHLAKIVEEMGAEYGFPGAENDVLFETTYEHVGGPDAACDEAEALNHCNFNRVVQRSDREHPSTPVIHYGNIASADKVMRYASERDRIAKELGVLCFEMEAAGLDENFRCMVIRGICDYSDSHKHKRWQRYAASTAAAFAKEILSFVRPQGLDGMRPAAASNETVTATIPLEAKKALPAPSHTVPFSSKGMPTTNDFVPREEEMEVLRSYFALGADGRRSVAKTLVVCGMGGIGKTQLCVEFARQHKSFFDSVWWLDGSSRSSLQQSLAESASRALGILVERDFTIIKAGEIPVYLTQNNVRDISTQFLSWLSEGSNRNWLVVYDNVDRDWTQGHDNDAYNIKDFLPDCDHGNTLVTTRLSHLLRSKKRLRLDRVNDEQARRILEARAGKVLPDAQVLVDRLGGLPLALAQAGCYLRRPLTVQKYLDMYEQTWTRLMHSQQQWPLEEYLERSLLTTWVLSYEQVVRESPAAAGVLRLWAYMDSGDLWFDLLAASTDKIVELKWPMWYSSLVYDELAFHDRMNVLLAYSLADISASGEGYSMHRVVHDWTRHQIGTAHEQSQLYRMVVYLVSARSAGADEELERRLLPHARHAAKNIQLGCTEKDIASLSTIAKLLDSWKESAVSARLCEHILAVCQTTLGPDHDWTLRAITIAADVYTKAGLFTQGSVFYERALGAYKSRYGKKSASALDTLHRWAVLERDHGDMTRARNMFEETLRGYKDTYGSDHEKTYLTAYDIARSCYALKSRRTQELLELSLRGKTVSLGLVHELTVENSYQLGRMHFHMKSYGAAERLWNAALEYELAGESTVYNIPALWSLSTMYLGQKRLAEAEEALLRLRKLIIIRYGSEHDTFTPPMHLLSWAYRHQNKLEEAEEVLTHLLDLHGAAHGIDNEDSYNMQMELARVRLRMGKLAEALRSFQRAGSAANKSTKEAQAHVQFSIDFCNHNSISERELQGVLTYLDFPSHSNLVIRDGLHSLVARRTRDQKAKRLSYASRLPVAVSSKASPPSARSKKSPVSLNTSVKSTPQQLRGSTTYIEEPAAQSSPSPSRAMYCNRDDGLNCSLFASEISRRRSTKQFLQFWKDWAKAWAPELLFPPWPYQASHRSRSRSSTLSSSVSRSPSRSRSRSISSGSLAGPRRWRRGGDDMKEPNKPRSRNRVRRLITYGSDGYSSDGDPFRDHPPLPYRALEDDHSERPYPDGIYFPPPPTDTPPSSAMRDTATEIDIEPASSMPKVTLEYGSRHMQRTPSAHLKQTRRRAYVEEVNQYEDNAEDSDLHNLDKATRSSDSHRPSEKAGWALPEYRPAEYHSRSSSIDSRGRSTSGWWETAK